MTFYFFESAYEFEGRPKGTQVAYARSQWDVNRKDYAYVKFDEVQELAKRLAVGPGKKLANLVARLDRAAENYHLAATGFESTDSAMANWIVDKATLAAIQIIVKAGETTPHLMKDVLRYAGSELDAMNQINLGLGEIVIEKWFATAPYVLHAMKAAENGLRARGYGKDKVAASISAFQQENNMEPHADDSLTRENRLYGRDLPQLYERMTGDKFESVKDSAGQVELLAGHDFVARAALVIGSGNPTTRAIHEAWKAANR